MRHGRLSVVGVLGVVCGIALAGPREVFEHEGGLPRAGLVVEAGEPVPTLPAGSAMLDRLAGIEARFGAREIGRLVRAAGDFDADDALEATHTLWLEGRRGSWLAISLGATEDGWVAWRDGELDNAVLIEGEAGLPRANDAELLPGEIVAFGVRPSPIDLDRGEIGKRFFGGGRARFTGAARLDDDTLFIRLPAGYDEADPPGILVWVDPTDRGVPPHSIHAAADELNLICVGAINAGNRRPVHDRLQLALDGVATVSANVPVRLDRVYATGMSGGGRCVGMLWLGFEDVFSGGVAIVGLNSQHVVHASGRMLQAALSKPSRSPREGGRLAAITGDADFNHLETLARINALTRDGYDAKAFTVPDMGHTMPAPERFAEALQWVDEQRDELLTTRRARTALARHDERFREDASSERAIESLVRIAGLDPWGPVGWEVAERLGHGP